MVGSTVVEVRAYPGEVRIALAGDSSEVALVLHPADVRRRADSATAHLGRRRAATASWSVRFEEPGVRSGVLELHQRRTPRGLAWYSLFAADDVVGGVRDSVGLSDVRLVLRALRAAAAAAVPTPRRPRSSG
jgi:hypothetical protein